ncbi:MAG TPA: beta-galactosidase [Capsulimonadaceae bacterium]|jgi:beta-galactosidase
MKVGASYYPEVIHPSEWSRDLATARDLGLSVLRCGEFAWSSFSPEPDTWTADWANEFLDVASGYGFDVIWCTPSATPPPYLFDNWPGLHAIDHTGLMKPVGVRRNYCPTHEGYKKLCGEVAARLQTSIGSHLAITGWQVDNEIAGDGFTCWCGRCAEAFREWLRARYGSVKALNDAWQTGIWSQVYTDWSQIVIPFRSMGAHAPSLHMAYRRFRADTWLGFYSEQYAALKGAGAGRVTTNFYNMSWDMPFDRWKWREFQDAYGLSHYIDDEAGAQFELAVLRGPRPGQKPLWVLEQKAGQQAAQNLYPDDLGRLQRHLRYCAEVGSEYAIYWHLRQHSAGWEAEHGAVLRHDGKPTRIAEAVKEAIFNTRGMEPNFPDLETILLFSFEQQWANESRPQPGSVLRYREQIEQNWFAGVKDICGDVRVGNYSDIAGSEELIIAPFAQVREPGMMNLLRDAVMAGAKLLITPDFGRLDIENNVIRDAPLGALHTWGASLPEIDMLQLREGVTIDGRVAGTVVVGSVYWAQPTEELQRGARYEEIGSLEHGDETGCAVLRTRLGEGHIFVAMTALDRAGVAALVRMCRSEL